MRTYRRQQVKRPDTTEQKQLRQRLAVESVETFSIRRLTSYIYNYLMFALLQAFPPANSNSMCKYYGHVVNHASWKRGFPTCQDCGRAIRCPSELRSANIKEESKC